MNKLYKMIAALEKIKQFAAQCPQGKRGRPLSVASAQRLGDENICEKKRRDGETIYYKTSGQIEKEKKEKETRREERKKIGAKARGRFSKISLSKIEELRNKLKDAVLELSSYQPASKQKKQTKKREQPQQKRKVEKKERSVSPEQKREAPPTKEIEPKIEANTKLTPSASVPSEKGDNLKEAKKVIKSIVGKENFVRTQLAANIMSMTSGLSVDESKKIIENDFPGRGSIVLTEEDSGGNWIEAVKSAVSRIQPSRNDLLEKEIKEARTEFINKVKEESNGWRRMGKIDLFYDVVKKRVPDIKDSEFISKLYDMFFNDKLSLAPVADKFESAKDKFVFPMRYNGELAYIR